MDARPAGKFLEGWFCNLDSARARAGTLPSRCLVEPVECGELPRDFLAALAVREESTDGVMMLAFGHPGRCLNGSLFKKRAGF